RYAARQRELGDDRSRFAQEREEAGRRIARDLWRVRVGRAEISRVARVPGFRRRVWEDLREAATLPAPEGGWEQVRAAVLGCLGDPVGLDPVENPAAVPRQKPREVPKWLSDAAAGGPLAVSPYGNFFATARDRVV